MSTATGEVEFFKMSGSGNDFVVVDGRQTGTERLLERAVVRRVCARRTGVGADGIIVLAPDDTASFRMIYLNSDGSRAAMCGNAALCSARLAVELGIVGGEDFHFETDAGLVQARLRKGLPEIDLAPISEVQPEVRLALEGGEQRMGFVLAGVPHLVVEVADVDMVDVDRRGSRLRHDPALPNGANVDFIAATADRNAWLMRTYERGVEGETLACGTGAVAVALMLAAWGSSGMESTIRTRSGLPLDVRLRREGVRWHPSLAGEGRIVFRGVLSEIGEQGDTT